MFTLGGNNRSQIASCLAAANNFLLTRQQAIDLVEDLDEDAMHLVNYL